MRLLWSAVLAVSVPAHAGSTTYFPDRDTFGLLMVEDRWPCAGDGDFNDVVLAYNLRLEQRAGDDVELVLNLDVRALGASLCNGVGIRLPVDATSVGTVTRELGTAGDAMGAWDAPTVVTQTVTSGEPVLWLAEDLRAELCGDATGFVNSDPDVAPLSCRPMRVRVPFTTDPGALSLDVYDLFVHRCGDHGHQIHLPQYAGTAEMTTSLFGTCDDASTVATHFVHGGALAGLPFALEVPETALWPIERTRIDLAQPLVADFAAGTGGLDWYLPEHAEPGLVFEEGAGIPLPEPVKHLPATLVTAGGVTSWTDGYTSSSCHEYRNPGATGYRDYAGATGDGVFLIDPEEGGDAFPAYCDMDGTDGWTLVAKVDPSSTWHYSSSWWTDPTGTLNPTDFALTSGPARFPGYTRVGYTRLRVLDPATGRKMILGDPATSVRAKLAGPTADATVLHYDPDVAAFTGSNTLNICVGNTAYLNANPDLVVAYNATGTYVSNAQSPTGTATGNARIGAWISGSESHIWTKTSSCGYGVGVYTWGPSGVHQSGTTVGSFTSLWVR